MIAARFLLDANLSPNVGRFLTRQVQLDVFSLQGQRLGQLPDHEVIRMARSKGGSSSPWMATSPRTSIAPSGPTSYSSTSTCQTDCARRQKSTNCSRHTFVSTPKASISSTPWSYHRARGAHRSQMMARGGSSMALVSTVPDANGITAPSTRNLACRCQHPEPIEGRLSSRVNLLEVLGEESELVER
ncbi:MAG: DUF5615 family PIN-like protein [Chloroflexia bacterium]|nr:DUF5615 family PIN-like protein [Chloroflexia bacterium]